MSASPSPLSIYALFRVSVFVQQISELQRQHELIRLSSVSLVKMHQKAVQLCQQNDEQLTGATLVDGRYTHLEVGGAGSTPGLGSVAFAHIKNLNTSVETAHIAVNYLC